MKATYFCVRVQHIVPMQFWNYLGYERECRCRRELNVAPWGILEVVSASSQRGRFTKGRQHRVAQDDGSALATRVW